MRLRDPPLLIAVDHEGGRVQRFRDGFTPIPAMRTLGELWDRDVAAAAREAARLGLDARLGAARARRRFQLHAGSRSRLRLERRHRRSRASTAIPTRSRILPRRCATVSPPGVWRRSASTFRGTALSTADSHDDLPVDDRTLERIAVDDLVPFAALVKRGLAAIMPAHVVYPAVDARPAGYSRRWLEDILRARLGFDGLVISDDLGMAGGILGEATSSRAPRQP